MFLVKAPYLQTQYEIRLVEKSLENFIFTQWEDRISIYRTSLCFWFFKQKIDREWKNRRWSCYLSYIIIFPIEIMKRMINMDIFFCFSLYCKVYIIYIIFYFQDTNQSKRSDRLQQFHSFFTLSILINLLCDLTPVVL